MAGATVRAIEAPQKNPKLNAKEAPDRQTNAAIFIAAPQIEPPEGSLEGTLAGPGRSTSPGAIHVREPV